MNLVARDKACRSMGKKVWATDHAIERGMLLVA